MPVSAILAAVDFSSESLRAAQLAARLARRHGAKLTLLHVDPMDRLLERMALRTRPDVWEQFLLDRMQSAHHLLEEARASLGEVDVQVDVVQEDPAAGIVERAIARRSELVVLGARGTGSSGRSWLGTVAFEVAAHVPCAVLVVREHGLPRDGPGFRRPLIAVGLHRPIEPAVATAASLCDDDAVFDMVHVAEWPSSLSERFSSRSRTTLDSSVARARAETLEKGASWLKAATARVRDTLVHLHLDEGESTSAAILDRIERKANDLVVLGRRAPPARSGSLGPAVRRLLEYADVSVALVPVPEPESHEKTSQGKSWQQEHDSAR